MLTYIWCAIFGHSIREEKSNDWYRGTWYSVTHKKCWICGFKEKFVDS